VSVGKLPERPWLPPGGLGELGAAMDGTRRRRKRKEEHTTAVARQNKPREEGCEW